MEKLKDEFVSQLDEALILAIAGEYDLTDSVQFDAAREVLLSLAKNVDAEQAVEGLLGGADRHAEVSVDGSESAATRATRSVRKASMSSKTSQSTGMRSPTLTTNLELLSLLDPIGEPLAPATSAVDTRSRASPASSEEQAVEELKTIFVQLKDHDIASTLKKANGDVEKAMDELLNIQLLEAEGLRPKGIDAFFRPDDALPKKRKGKKKGRAAVPLSDHARQDGASHADDVYMRSYEDILYLSQLLDRPFEAIQDAYHANGNAMAPTALTVLSEHIKQHSDLSKVVDDDRSKSLAAQYRNVPDKYVAAIIDITGDAFQWADELAQLLNKHLAKSPPQRLNVNYTLSPIQDELDGFASAGGVRRAHSTSPAGSSSASYSAALHSLSRPPSVASAIDATTLSAARLQQTQASLAQVQRKGNSNPLFRQAAAYYASESRERSRDLRAATSALADVRADQGNNGKQVDLHGMLVDDGVRIAKDRVWMWWNSLGEFKTREAKQEGFIVVTGRGNHNTGGVSRMRQSVFKALRADGWKIEVETGRFRVTGRA